MSRGSVRTSDAGPAPEPAAATVTVLLFARLREAAGRERTSVAWAPGMTVGDVADRLRVELPDLPLRGSLCAVNERYARPHDLVEEGDTVAFLPPISGG